jgi:F5/8 type C domain
VKSVPCRWSAVRWWLAVGAIGLLSACQQPEIDPPTDGPPANSTVPEVGVDETRPTEVMPEVADAGAEVTDTAASPDLPAEKPAPVDVSVEMVAIDVAPETGPPDTMPIGPCAARSPPLAPTGWTATASVQSPGDVTARAFDGQVNSRWSTGTFAVVGQWYRLDLGAARTINRLQLDSGAMFPLDYPRGYAVTLSADDVTYHPVAMGTDLAEPITTVSFPAESARYAKITLTARDQRYWWGITELIVCGY